MVANEDRKQIMLEALSKEPAMVIETAYLYARTYVDYGEDITKAWNTATQHVAILEKAYNKGYTDAVIVTSTREKGRWVANHDESDDSHTIDCSCCGYTLVRVVNRGYTAERALDCVKDMVKNYCPSCGAEMEGEE